MDISEIRRRNLQQLMNRVAEGRQTVLGDMIGRAPSVLSQIITGKRGLGERLARHIEASVGVETGSLDRAINGVKDPGIYEVRPDHAPLSPRTLAYIARLERMVRNEVIVDEDIDALDRLLDRLTSKRRQ